MLNLSDQVRLVALEIEHVSLTACLAVTGNLQKYELAEYFPKTKHFRPSFYANRSLSGQVLYFNIIFQYI